MLKRILRVIGVGLTLASIVFLGFALVRQFGAIRDMAWEATDFVAISAATVLFLIAFLVLAVSWALMLEDGTRRRQELISDVSIYARTSILKYLPGNVFHFVGRNVAGHRPDRGHLRLASASVLEIGLSLLSALLLASILFLFVPAPAPKYMIYLSFGAALTTALIILFQPRALSRLCGIVPFLASALPKNLGLAMVWNTIAFAVIMAAAAVLSVAILSPNISPASATALYIVGWLIGFAIPGAPGGLGVREAFLVIQLAPITGEPEALTFALLTRLASTVGDVLLFVVGTILKAKMRRGSDHGVVD